MREFSFIYEEGLIVGLIPSEKVRRNMPGLIEAYNVRVEKEGIAPYTPITNPFVGVPGGTAWPYPQVFYTKRGIMVATETAIYSVDDSYILTPVISGVTAGNIWTLADYDSYQVWTNGTVTVIRDVSLALYGSVGMTHTIESVCDYNGQLVAGGLGTGKENWVAWSDIGSATLTTLLSDIDNKNTKGFMPMDFRGDIYQVKKLGKGVMVYGANGIGYIHPAQTTFGKMALFPFGIGGKGWVGGDENKHLFIDLYGYVHIIDASLKHTLLGYSNYINTLVGDIVVTFDPITNDFYISDGTLSYLLTITESDTMSLSAGGFKSGEHKGLSEVFQCPSGITRVGGLLIGYTYDNADRSAYITTNSFDIQTRSIKTIQTVEASVGSTSVQGAIDYIYRPEQAFTRSTLKTLSSSGIFTPMVSGVDLRVHIEVADYTDFFLDSLTIRYKMSDKRTIRGPYAEPKNL